MDSLLMKRHLPPPVGRVPSHGVATLSRRLDPLGEVPASRQYKRQCTVSRALGRPQGCMLRVEHKQAMTPTHPQLPIERQGKLVLIL